MIRTLIHIILFCAIPLVGMAQNWESIKSNNLYLYGEGWGTTVADADKQALEALISKIAVNVSSESSNTGRLVNNNGDVEEVSQFSQSINTFSQATLTNTERIILKNEPNAHVGRWIKRAEIEKIFESRKRKALDLVEAGLRAVEKGKADDALRNYYWARILLRSLQRPNDVVYTDEGGKNHVLTNWLKEQIDDVFDDLQVTAIKRDGDDVELRFTYKGKPVNSLDYTYFDGRDWSNIYSAKDGRGVIELAAGNTSKQFRIKYEYEYRGEAQIDKEIESVLAVVKSIPMPNAYVNVDAPCGKAKVGKNHVSESFSTTDASVIKRPKDLGKESKEYQNILEKVASGIKSRNASSVSQYFTPEGFLMYTKLIHYGNAKLLDSPSICFYDTGNGVMSRGLMMSFSFANGVRKSFVEDVVFTFDTDKKISNVAFGLGKTAEDDILNKGVWSESARVAIMNFLENYKTAYALKRMDYITSVFDDDAVIITATVVNKSKISNIEKPGLSLEGDKIVKYNRQTKDQYLKNLERCFTKNEFVNIRFANNDVYKLGKGGELYAIQISQDYYSSTYGDKGYLFLMVDINDPEKPLIKVRTWQPEKDPNFGLYGPGDF